MTDLEALARADAERAYRSSDPVAIYECYRRLRERLGLPLVTWDDFKAGKRGDP